MDAVQRTVQRERVENIPFDDLSGCADQGPHLVRAPGQTSHDDRLAFEQRKQPPADVP